MDGVPLVIVGKVLLPLAAAIGSILVYKALDEEYISPAYENWLYIALWAATRLGVFVLLFLVLGMSVRSDVPSYYLPEARAALDALVVYRDFGSSYGPLFPYIAAIAVSVWNSAKSIVLLSILIEALSIVLWLRIGRRFFSEATIRLATVAYLCSGVVLINVAVNGQNQVWLSLAAAATLWLCAKGRPVAAGLLAGIGVLATKLLFVVLLPVFFYASRRRLRWALSCVAVLGAGYGVVAALGGEVLQPLVREAGEWTSGNLPYLLTIGGIDVRGASAGYILFAVLGGALAAVYLGMTRGAWRAGVERGSRIALLLVPAVMLVFLLFSKKSYTNYLGVFYFPMVMGLARAGWARAPVLFLAGIGVFNVVAAVEPSMWHRMLELKGIQSAWLSADVGRGGVFLFVLVDLVLVAFYSYFAVDLYREVENIKARYEASA